MDRRVCVAPERSWKSDLVAPARFARFLRGFARIAPLHGFSRRCELPITTAVRNPRDPASSGMKAVADICSAMAARGEIRSGLRPARVFPRPPQNGPFIGHQNA